MKWKKFTLTTTTEAVDLISYTLDELGIEGIEIEDNIPLTEKETKGMFIDILPELPPDEGVAKVSFYLDEDDDIPAMMVKVKEALEELKPFTDLGAYTFAESETEDKDWINNWKQYFKPFTVDHILIKPTWETVPEEHKDKLLIQIDPGTAFGTGMHETTQLCIRQLEKYVTPDSEVLDVGTGSGILGITALKLGAKHVFGTDLDENAITAVGENLEANGIAPEQFKVVQGNIIDDKAVQDEGETSVLYLFQGDDKAATRKVVIRIMQIVMPILIFIWGNIDSGLAWNLSDLALGGSTWINMLVVLLLSPKVFALYKDYEEQMKAKKDPYYNPDKLCWKGVDVEMWKDINKKRIAEDK